MNNRQKIRKALKHKCGNCGHEILVKEWEVRHQFDSYLCLEPFCLCLDATGRDALNAGARYPFNKTYNLDCMKNVVSNW
jgi:hypothetical protein